MKIIYRFMTAVVICIMLTTTVSATVSTSSSNATTEAEELTGNVTIEASQNMQNIGVLSDRNRTTRFTVSGETEITISSETEIASMYFMWDKPPSGWTLGSGNTSENYGKYGFLHEYVKLSPTNDITISWTEGDVVLGDIYLFGQGEVPNWVQKWKPPYKDADMLVLPTHADDEHLFFGGTMSYYAGELGYKVQVAYLTNHATEIYRQHELLNGLWVAGITAYPVISDFPDLFSTTLEYSKQIYDENEVMDFQVMLLRRFKPEVVVGHDINGEYGHGVHMLNADTLIRAIPMISDSTAFSESFDEYGTHEVQKVYLHLYPENEITMDWNIPLDAFGGKTALDMAKAGFAEHYSQQTYFAVEDFGAYDCRKFGLYHTTVGKDKEKLDFFENVEFSTETISSDVESSSSQSLSESSQQQSSSSVSSSSESSEVNDGGGSSMVTVFIVLGAVVVAGVIVFIIYKGKTKKE